ncbi:MAG: DUF2273 domain-containing protein [Tomitella sp.]|nr:DUF2273 domain-containing protein [Tomitella sp.]
MNTAAVGLIAGILLIIAGTTGGIIGFLLALILGGIGFAIGAHRDGTIDLAAVLRTRGRG